MIKRLFAKPHEKTYDNKIKCPDPNLALSSGAKNQLGYSVWYPEVLWKPRPNIFLHPPILGQVKVPPQLGSLGIRQPQYTGHHHSTAAHCTTALRRHVVRGVLVGFIVAFL